MSKKRIKKTRKTSSKSIHHKQVQSIPKRVSGIKSKGIFTALTKAWEKDKFEFLFISLAIFIFLFFGMHHIGQFFTTDETVWLNRRYPNFWNSIHSQNWSNTVEMKAQAGILQMLISGNAIHQFDLRSLNPNNFEDFLFAWRFPLLIFNFLCLPLIYFLSRKLCGKITSIIFIILMSTFPFLIGISQVFGKDPIMWSTSMISVLAFFVSIKFEKFSYSILSGIFLGLALLSKFPATLLIPFYFMVIYLEYLFKNIDQQGFVRLLKQYAILIISMFLIVYVLLPACWFNLNTLFKWTLGPKIVSKYVPYYLGGIGLLVLEIILIKGRASNWVRQRIDIKSILAYSIPGVMLVSIMIIFTVVIFNVFEDISIFQTRGRVGRANLVNDFIPAFFSGIKTLVSNFPHLVLIGLISTLGLMLIKPKKLKEHKWLLYLLIFIFIYYLGASISGARLGMRYQSLIIPSFILISAASINTFITKKRYLWVSLILVIGLVELAHFSPFYMYAKNLTDVKTYFNPGVGWGVGGYEMAEEMNKDPNVGSVNVFCDYEGFSRFFKGRSSRYNFREMPTQTYLNQFDYLFLSSSGYSQMSRNSRMTPALQKYYDIPLENSWAFLGNARNFVRIVPVK